MSAHKLRDWSSKQKARLKAFRERIGKHNPVFGVPIDDDVPEFPVVFVDALAYFRINGVAHEGLFRVSGDQTRIAQLRALYDRGKVPDLSREGVHVIAGLLKLWLRVLPMPLISYDLYDALMDICDTVQDENLFATKLRSVLDMLSRSRYRLLHTLCKLLSDVSHESDVNLMSAQNIAIVFAPTLLRPKALSEREELSISLGHTKHTSRVMTCLIVRYSDVFKANPPDVLEEQVRTRASCAPTAFQMESLESELSAWEAREAQGGGQGYEVDAVCAGDDVDGDQQDEDDVARLLRCLHAVSSDSAGGVSESTGAPPRPPRRPRKSFRERQWASDSQLGVKVAPRRRAPPPPPRPGSAASPPKRPPTKKAPKHSYGGSLRRWPPKAPQ